MDERTMLNLATFYDAIMKTNHDYGRDKYFYVVIFIVILLIGIIIYMYVKPRTVTEVRYVPYYSTLSQNGQASRFADMDDKNQISKENFQNIQNTTDQYQYQPSENHQILYNNSFVDQNLVIPNNNYNYNLI